MAEASVTAPFAASSDELWLRARNPEAWTAVMPGVVSSKETSDGGVEWRISSPMGESLVRFDVTATDDSLSYRSVHAESPFTRIEMFLSLRDGALHLDLVVEATPPFPPAMVSQLAQAAIVRLSERAPGPDLPRAEREVITVPMSDGVSLEAHLYRAAAEIAPSIVMLFPYRKESNFLPIVASSVTSWGYHFLVADVRGIGGSRAPYEGLWSDREITDFVELIEWTAEQPFCDGGVATFGGSYCGGNQLLVAARRPKGLRCITPIVGMVDTYRDWTHRGGIPSHANWGAMTYLRSQQHATAKAGLEQYYADLYLDEFDNDAHRARSPETGLDEIDVPTLAVGGWHDYFLRGTTRTYLRVNVPKRLVIGPWGHGEPPPFDELEKWFGYHLRGEGEQPRGIRAFITGAEEWRAFDEWPDLPRLRWNPVDEPTELEVVSHVEALPMAANVKPQFMPDPTDSGMSVWSEGFFVDSEPFTAPALVFGHIGCTLRLEVSGCEDVDVRVRLSVVRPDGIVKQLNEGRLRASHRRIDEARSIITGGEVIVPWHTHDVTFDPIDGVFDVHVEIDPIGHEFQPGDRLRFGLTLTRADEGTATARAVLHPETRLLTPVR